MKILLLAPQPFFQLRGTPIAVRRVCEVLCASGHSVDVITLHEGQDVDIPGCTVHRVGRPPLVHHVPPGFSFSKIACGVLLFAKALTMCRATRFDVVHAVEDGAFVAMAIRLIHGVPFVFDMDSSMPEQIVEKYPALHPVIAPLRWAETAAIRQSSGVVTVCRALEEVVLRADPDKPTVRVEDVSPVPLHASDPPSDVDWESGPVVLYVGNLEGYQGIDLLLRAFAEVVSKGTNASLVVVGGSAAHIESYEAVSRDLGIEGSTRFLGPRPLDAVGAYMQAADVLVSPRSRGNNTPMKIFSYLESGTPVVATDLPTHSQVLNAQTAWLAPADARSFADAIHQALTQKDATAAKAAHALRRMATEFDRATLDGKLERFYQDLGDRLGLGVTMTPAPAVAGLG